MQSKKSKNNNSWKWGTFSLNQVHALTWWKEGHPAYDKEIIIADGSVRSGKTISMSFSYVMWAMCNFDGELFGCSGKTIGSFRKNVLRDLTRALKARGAKVREKLKENIFEVSYNGSVNEFEIFGGKDEGSYALIQGRTLAGMFFDEVTLQPKSFVDQALARCSVEGSRIWMNCNPDGPFNYIKVDYIDQAENKNVLYLHFELDENKNISQDIINRLKSLYTGLFYKRYIQGLWVIAEGAVYDMFDWNTHSSDLQKRFNQYIVGVDYGTSNPCTFGLYGFDEFRGADTKVNLVKEFYYDSSKTKRQKTDGQYRDDFLNFIAPHRADGSIKGIYIDPSALSFITELKKPEYGIAHLVKSAKNDVIEGIRFVAQKLTTNTYLMDKSCIETKKEYETYSWDPNAQKRGEDKPLKQNDHTPDRDRYAIYTHFAGKQYKKRTQTQVKV